MEWRDSEEDIVKENGLFQANPDNYNGEMYGGIIFPPDFQYGPDGSVPDLDYVVRFGTLRFTSLAPGYLFPVFQTSGPGFEGMQRS